MDGDRPRAASGAAIETALAPLDDETDYALIDEMLRMKISDRLRTLTQHVEALRRFGPV